MEKIDLNKKSQLSQKQQEDLPINFNEKELKMSIIVACQRTSSDMDMTDLDLMVSNVASEFKTLTHDHIIKAIRNGSLGKYGKTYKLCTQEVCIWVRTYAEEMDLNLETPQEMIDRKNREASRF